MEYRTRATIGIILIIIGIIGASLYNHHVTPSYKPIDPEFYLGLIIYLTLVLGAVSIGIAIKEARTSIPKEERILKKDKKDKINKYKIAFPYYCEHCNQFTHALLEICEICGVKNTIRVAKNEDYQKIFKT
ncbi:MAG: hypothetical protein ACFFA0_05870 [Promethearchaeota archaeon]